MNTSKVIWTTLPNCVRRDADDQPWMAHISLFITPRLTPQGATGTLRDFSEWRDWPATLQKLLNDGLEFSVQVHDDANLRAPVRVPPPPLPKSDAWKTLLPLSTPVKSRDTGPLKAQSSIEALPYSPASLSQELEQAYKGVFDRGLNKMKVSDADPLQSFRVTSVPSADTVALYESTAGASAVSNFVAFNQATQTRKFETNANTLDDAPDFHQIISMFSAHPALLRQLGLIIDLKIPVEALGLKDGLNDLSLRVAPTALPASIETHSFWTAAEYGSAGDARFQVFCPAAESRKAHFGFYALGGNKMTLTQSQFEHGALALVQHVSGDQSNDLPRLLQGGMRILDPAIPAQVRNAIGDQQQLEGVVQSKRLLGAIDEPDNETTLFAEQLTRGYRIDVRDVDATDWRSLCRRSNYYESGNWTWPRDGTRLSDEGSVEFTAYENQNQLNAGMHVSEDLFSWDGWSLAVPRPDGIDPVPNNSGRANAPVKIDMQVEPGSLLPQRFGHCYQFRARIVDIAGNSLSLEDASGLVDQLPMPSLSSPPTCCLRVESILPPTVVTPKAKSPKEGDDTLVILDAEDKRFRTSVFRTHIFPPQISVDMAERHGMFDNLDAEAAWSLIEQHQGSLDGIELPASTDDVQYTPYLPDPLAMQGVVTLPNRSERIELPRFDAMPANKPNSELARSCLLTLRPGKNELLSEIRGHELTLQLPKGRVQEITFSTKLAKEDLGKMALTATLQHPIAVDNDSGTPALLAPTRVVRVIHASQRPLTRPVFEAPILLARQANQTETVLVDNELLFDIRSTGRLDVYANWDDVTDNPQSDAWETFNHELHAGGLDIDDDELSPFGKTDETKTTKPAPLTHDFGDTKHHEVRYRAVAVSRFVDLYPTALTEDPSNMNRISSEVILHVPSTAAPAVPAVSFVLPTFRHQQEQLGAGVVDATQEGNGLRIYLERGWFSSGNGEQLALIMATDSLADDKRDEASDWGVNTLHDTAGLPGALRSKHIVSGERLTNDALNSDGVELVVHDVHFSNEHKAPFVDIEFIPTMTFMPLVRLVLARYQAHSIEGCHLSPATTTDFIPLAPDRALSVQRQATDTWSLTVRGHSYSEQDKRTSVMQAHLEVLSVNTPEDAAAWTAVGEPVILEALDKGNYNYQWSGPIGIDSAEWPSRRWHRRLVVAEYEPFDVEGLGATPLADHSRLISAHTVKL